MKTSEENRILNREIVCKLACMSDADAISQLNKKWLKIGESDLANKSGFLFGDPLSKDDIEAIILNKELIVAFDEKRLAGYYLLDNYSNTNILTEHEAFIAHCIEKGLIPPDSKISKRMQCVVDLEYQMQGLSTRMFTELREYVANKYDLLFATASKDNPKYMAHIKVGWEIVDEINDLYLLTYIMDYATYSDELLIEMMVNSYDLDESMFFVLGELGNRKHPRTEEFCLKAIDDHMGYDEHFVSSAIHTLYSVNELKAIEIIQNRVKEFHIYAMGSILSLLWVDSSIYTEMPEKVALIETLKVRLQELSESDIATIQKDYDEFVQAYMWCKSSLSIRE